MRVQVLSDFGGQQFGRAVHHLQLAETNVVAWHESYLQTRQDRRERRTKSWWQRLLDSTGEEREVSARARPAWQGVAGLTLADSGSRRTRQQVAGLLGEDAVAVRDLSAPQSDHTG